MSIWKAWAFTPWTLVNGRYEMQICLDFPTANVSDYLSQLDEDARALGLTVCVGIAPTDAALNAVKADANLLVLAQIQVDDANGDVIHQPVSTTLDDAVTLAQINAVKTYLTGHGIDLTKYNLNTDLAVGKTRRQVLQAALDKLEVWLA